VGGLGSGNGGAPRCVTYTDECLQLKVGNLGKIKPGSSGSAQLRRGSSVSLSCQHEGQIELSGTLDKRPWSQTIELDFTYTDGIATGRRAWFLCLRCNARCRSLYLRTVSEGSNLAFLCRKCQRLRYRSQSLGELDRAYRKQSGIARKINPKASATDFPRRPRGMQRRTFDKLWRAWCDADWKREEITTRELVGIALRYYSDGL
jgi:hypothetical protein